MIYLGNTHRNLHPCIIKAEYAVNINVENQSINDFTLHIMLVNIWKLKKSS